MRGIGRKLSRLPLTLSVLAGVILSGGAGVPKAHSQPEVEETAMAVPRLSLHRDGLGLPRPLDMAEAARLKQILAAQRGGDLATAARETAVLDTSTPLGRSMLGYVLADRYLRPGARASAAELTDWLAHHPDLTEGPALYDLLKTRLPAGAALPPPPAAPQLDVRRTQEPPEESPPRALRLSRNHTLDDVVRARAEAGNLTAALRLIAKRAPNTLYAAQLRAEVARTLFAHNQDTPAFEMAKAALADSGNRVGLAGYVAGLAAWRQGHPDVAQPLFEAAANADSAPAALKSAAGYWAARAHLRNKDLAGFIPWLKQAADEPRTFYGLLARRVLGVDPGAGFSWTRETLGEADVEAVADTEEGLDALALLQLGETEAAEGQLARLAAARASDTNLLHSVMLVAEKAGMYGLGAQLAMLAQSADGRPRDFARYPMPPLHPRDGFLVDPPLVYAVTRVESNFDPSAHSAAGACGLMQLLPDTARYVVGRGLAERMRTQLYDPALNLDLGQRYLLYLAGREGSGGDLLRLLASYNAGPNKLGRWTIRDQGDPLLFIESIPVTETRNYVQRVLTYNWIYAARLNLPLTSLDELASGAFPHLEDDPTLKPAAVAMETPQVH